MNKLFRYISVLVVLVMVLGFFVSPMSTGNQVNAQKEVPTFVVAPTDVPTQEPTVPPPQPGTGEEQPTSIPGDPGAEITPEPTSLPETGEPPVVVPLIEAAADVAVPGRYIVVFKSGTDMDAARLSALEKIAGGGGKVAFEYASALDGIAVEISPEVLRKLRQDPRIEYIEQDQKVSVHDEETPFSAQNLDSSPVSWGLDRIDQVSNSRDWQFYYPSSAGVGVNVYIIDSGIFADHEQYAGRVSLDFDSIVGSTPYAYDCAGHGTHVAGTVGGIKTGVARKVNLHSIRVLDCSGSGNTSQIIAGIDWVAKNHIKPAVANMSLGGYISPAEDAAVNKAIAKGVTFVVSAGNSDTDACNVSPARVPGAITVGATNDVDQRVSPSNTVYPNQWGSNYGRCLDIFAPGEEIYSSVMGSTSGYASWSGTSMAAPHVTGVAALYLAANPTAKPAQVAAYITANALLGIVFDPGTGSPNRFLHIPDTIATGPTLVLPTANQVIPEQNPEFRWKLVTNADEYNLQIADNFGFSSIWDSIIVQDSFYEYAYNDIPDGDWYWRVRAINVDVTQGAWSAIRKFTVDTIGPVAPVQVYPADNAVLIGIPTFTWRVSPTAKYYRFALDFDGNPYLGDLAYISPETTKLLFKPADLPYRTSFYWYVQAIDSLGNEGDWSSARKIAVMPLKPAAPKLISPANNFTTANQTPEFTWSDVSYDDAYNIQVAADTKFTVIRFDYEDSLSMETYTSLVPLPEGKSYWRVRAKNGDGIYSDWSAYRTINIDITPPAAPNLSAPANGANVVGNPNFTWTVPVGAKTFTFEYDDDPGFSSPVISGLLTKANYKPVSAIPVGTWYWHVMAFDTVGNPSAISASRTVIISPPAPAKPILRTPFSNFYTSESSIELTWYAVDYAHHYEIMIDNSSALTSPEYYNIVAPGDISQTVDLVTNFDPGKLYWRVRAVNSNSVAGPWSSTRYFIESPSYDTDFSATTDLLNWTQHPGGAWDVDTTYDYAFTNGIKDSWETSSMSYNANLTNFSVVARMKMDPGTGGAYGGYYGLVVRGTPTFTDLNDWTKGYYFGISQSATDGIDFGCFSVYSLGKGMLSSFCDTAILENDWNTLKVDANGKNLIFFINNYLMWQGTDTSVASGRVGVFDWQYMDDFTGWGNPGITYVDYFRFGAPIMIFSTNTIAEPDGELGFDPFEKKYNH